MGSHARTAVTAVFFTALIIGFAYVMPAAVQRAARSVFFGAESTPPVLQATPGSGAVHLEGSEDSHGEAVRVAAQCKVGGRAHGRLVRAVARDKEATVESAEAACDEAMAEQSSDADDRGGQNATARPGKVKGANQRHGMGRRRGPKTGHKQEPSDGSTQSDDTTDAGDTSGNGTSTDGSGTQSDSTPEPEPSSQPGGEPAASPTPPPDEPGNGDENGNGGGNSGGNGNGNGGGNGNGNGNGGGAP